MREAVSISLPKQTTKEVKVLAKTRGFKSLSGYVKHLIELDKDLISEHALLASARTSRKEYQTGKTVTAQSLSDLV